MSFPCPIPGCGRNATEWMVCRTCAALLAGNLAAIPVLAREVETTLARQGAQGARSGPRSSTPALAYDPAASAAYGALKAVLVGWVRVLVEDKGHQWPADTVAGCATWLLARVGELRVHPAAVDIAVEVAGTSAACWRVIDRAPDRYFAGPCEGCSASMYAIPGNITVACPTPGCRRIHDVAHQRAVMLEGARDQLLSIPEMLRALPGLVGHELNDATLRQWHHRGRMLPHGRTLSGRDTFRVGDVLALLEDHRRVQP